MWTPRRRAFGWPWLDFGALAGCTALALAVAGETYLSMLDHGHSWWRMVGWQLGSWVFWAPLAPWLVRRGRGLAAGDPPRKRAIPIARALGPLALLAMPVAVLHLAAVGLLTAWLQPFAPIEEVSFAVGFRRGLVPWVYFDLIVYTSLLVVGALLGSEEKRRRSELRASQLATELAQAQLLALRYQLQPHFLFNTLHSIGALIRQQKSEPAFAMLLDLAALLRATLERGNNGEPALRAELDLLHRYVSLQRVRFGDRLDVRFAVADDCLDLAVPALALQALVENAIRYGLADRVDPLRVIVRAGREADGRWRLVVEDDGPGFPPGFDLETGGGVALRNLAQRLARIEPSPTAAALELGRSLRGGARVALVRPCTPALAST